MPRGERAQAERKRDKDPVRLLRRNDVLKWSLEGRWGGNLGADDKGILGFPTVKLGPLGHVASGIETPTHGASAVFTSTMKTGGHAFATRFLGGWR